MQHATETIEDQVIVHQVIPRRHCHGTNKELLESQERLERIKHEERPVEAESAVDLEGHSKYEDETSPKLPEISPEKGRLDREGETYGFGLEGGMPG